MKKRASHRETRRRRSPNGVARTARQRAELKAWMRRWKLVNAFERQELRRTPITTKAYQLAAMMAMAQRLAWNTSTEAELRRIRRRWARLKDVLRAG